MSGTVDWKVFVLVQVVFRQTALIMILILLPRGSPESDTLFLMLYPPMEVHGVLGHCIAAYTLVPIPSFLCLNKADERYIWIPTHAYAVYLVAIIHPRGAHLGNAKHHVGGGGLVQQG